MSEPTTQSSPEAFRDRYGPWAMIVGASHGIGAEFAKQVAAMGVNCVLLARRESALNELAAEITEQYGVKTRVIAADLIEPGAAKNIVDAVADLDVGLLIYNAGSPAAASRFLDAPLDTWEKLMRLNGNTPVELCYHFGPKLLSRGRGGLLLVGSQAALGGNKMYSLYTGSKALMLNFGESLWIEWKDRGIDVLNFLISVVDSPTLRSQMKKSGIEGWDAEDIGVPQPKDLAQLGLQQLSNGPTFLHPEDAEATAAESSPGVQRREAMVRRWEITAPFVGDG
jgi:short-subunit dehydrogenase